VSTGQSVKAKQKVAYVGPKYLPNGKLNGFTTGQHLHFTLYYNNKLINPLSIKYSAH
jgi:murein DD-endopeptidase MepM/ murein hydrolase activator NlpD